MNPTKLITILAIMFCAIFGVMSYYIAGAISNAPKAESLPNVFFTQEPTNAQVSIFDTYIAASETPTPLDYGALPITQTVVAVGEIEAAAQATIAASGSTQIAVAKIADGSTATARSAATDTAYAQATNDRILRDQNRIESEQQAKATLAIVLEYVWKVGGSIVLGLAISLGMAYKFHIEKLKVNRKAVERVTDDFLHNLSPVTVQVSTNTHSGYQMAISITPAEMVVLKQAVLDLKGDLSRSKIVAGNYFKERRWNTLDDELLRENAEGVALFERDTKGIHPTEAGYRWLGLPVPAPPLEEKSPETVEFPAIPVTARHVTGVSQAENNAEKEIL